MKAWEKKSIWFLWLVLLSCRTVFSQSPRTITVDAAQSLGTLNHFWGGMGQDSFNDGVLKPHNQVTFDLMKDMNDRLQKKVFNYIRVTGIFADSVAHSGEDIGGHVYYETESGEPRYRWTIVDDVFDSIIAKGLKPIVCLTYMPDDLASDPSNRNDWNCANVSPPKDYDKWRNLCYETVYHLTDRYGSSEIETWYFEVWNEPDLSWFFWIPHPDTVNHQYGSDNIEYFKLYDYAVDGAVQANPNIKIGGPAIAGDIQLYINEWMDHILNEPNFATGEVGTRIDFISRHGYGIIEERIIVNMDALMGGSLYWLAPSIYEKMRTNEIEYLVTETGPSTVPQPWLNTRYVSAWIVKEIDAILHLGDEKGDENVPDVLCFWTLPTPTNFDNQFGITAVIGNEWNPPAEGVVKRPAFNTYEMLGQLGDERIALTGTAYGDEIHGLATRDGNESVQVILYHLKENDFENQEVGFHTINLTIDHIPFSQGLLQIYKIDETHSNGFTAWKNLGRPTQPTPQVMDYIRKRDDLELAESEQRITISNGTLTKQIQLQNNSVAMIMITDVEGIPPDPNDSDEFTSNNIFGQLAHFEWLAAMPQGRGGQFSSYDRTGGDADFSNYLGTKPDGSKILASMDGPGCITRIWMTNSNWDNNVEFYDDTILKIYLNDESIPTISVPLKDFFGNYAHFVSPLAQRVDRAYISYVPIPYTSSCEVTVDLGSNQDLYYHINYRSFLNDNGVSDFGFALNSTDAGFLDDFKTIWSHAGADPYIHLAYLNDYHKDLSIQPGEEKDLFNIDGSGLITMIHFLEYDVEQLYNTRLKVYWDGDTDPAVDVPFSDFFGLRFDDRVYQRYYNSIPLAYSASGFYCYFPMPFSENARIAIVNTNAADLSVSSNLMVQSLDELDPYYGRFHALFREEYPTERDRPYEWLNISGRGKLVGIMMNLDNSIESGQIQEGDEIITVDSELASSWMGTGSADFFNQAWGFDEVKYPLHGTTFIYPEKTCYRFMMSDFVAFNSSIHASIEVGPQSTVVANSSSVAYYYLFDSDIDSTPPARPTNVRVIRISGEH